MWPAVIAAGVGLLQGMQQDRANKQAMKLQAEQNRYAPLFGQAPGGFQPMSQGNALSGALAGGMGGWQTAMNYEMMKNAMGSGGGSTGNDLAMNYMKENPYA